MSATRVGSLSFFYYEQIVPFLLESHDVNTRYAVVCCCCQHVKHCGFQLGCTITNHHEKYLNGINNNIFVYFTC